MRVCLVLAMAACNYAPGAGNATTGDAPIDPDGPPTTDDTPPGACTPWTTQAGHIADPCTPMPGDAVTFPPGSYTIDTTDGSITPAGIVFEHHTENGMRVISVEAFTIASGATVRVIGSMPLLVLSQSTITIDGVLDASSKRTSDAQVIGPGARGSNASNGGGGQDCGGGAGAGFGGDGGDGGNGNGNLGGLHGLRDLIAPTQVLGGRSGSNGGTGGSKGLGGAGGGAVQLTARVQVIVNGVVDAGGAGGMGGSGDGGGGGGGSGGYVGFDAPNIRFAATAIVVANGGGGATGCDGGNGPEGANGGRTAAQAAGGPNTGCTVATSGGAGGASGNGVNGSNSGESGGGGGGGTGFVLTFGQVDDQGALTSPNAQ